MMTSSAKALLIMMISSFALVESKSLLQHGSCTAEDDSELIFTVLEGDQCPVTSTLPSHVQSNSSTLSSVAKAISSVASMKAQARMNNLSAMSAGIKPQKLFKMQPMEASATRFQIKLQKPHKMRPQRRQIKVRETEKTASPSQMKARHGRLIKAEEPTQLVNPSQIKAHHGDLIKVGHPTQLGQTYQTSTLESLLDSPEQVSKEEVDVDLLSELKSTFRPGADHSRITQWEEAVRPLFLSLPKNDHGNLGHAAARYVLHRAFVRRHGWSLKGLNSRNTSTSSSALQEWVPIHLMDTIEQLLGTNGLDLQELAVIAATFEDLVHREELGRLKGIYQEMGIPLDSHVKKGMAQQIITTYMTIYTSDDAKTAKDVKATGLALEPETRKWLHEVQSSVTGNYLRLGGVSGTKDLDFNTTARIVEEVGERYGDFNDFECRALKKTLLELEDETQPGTVRLSDFYKKGMSQTYWNFNEKIGYLRFLGALDESSSRPHVIIPNYVASESNCLQVSSLYNVCCRSECESLMGQLEEKFQAAIAEPSEIAKLVRNLSSDTVSTPRTISTELMILLKDIAASNHGKVPLHSRDFAQWMHQAFPRECPAPHDSEKNPETPDEWLKESGAEGARATKEEIAWLAEQLVHAEDAGEIQMPWEVDDDDQQQCSPEERQPRARRLTTRSRPTKLTKARKLAIGKLSKKAQQLTARQLATRKIPEKAPKKMRQLATRRLAKDGQANSADVQPQQLEVIAGSVSQQVAKIKLAQASIKPPAKSVGKSSAKMRLFAAQPNLNSAMETFDAESFAEMLWEATAEPAQSYWDVEDRMTQQLDREDQTQIPTPPPSAPTEPVVHQSTVSMMEAVTSVLQQNSALVFLGLLLSLAVAHGSFAKSRCQKMKIEDPEAPLGACDMNLVRIAAAASVKQRWPSSASQDFV